MPPEQIPQQYQYQYQNQSALDQLPIKKLAVIGVILLAVIIGFSWLSNHSYVEFNVEGDGDVTYSLASAPGEDPEPENAPRSFKKLVTKGTYRAVIERDGQKYYAVIDAGGFLGTKTVNASLRPASGREFIGLDPGDCASLVKNILLSGDCKGQLAKLQTHVPATAKLGTYAKYSSNLTEDVVQGMVDTKLGTVVLTYEAVVAGHQEVDSNHSPHVAFVIKDTKQLFANRTSLVGLEHEKTYSIQAYKDGFIVYDTPTTNVKYYATPGSTPEIINIGQPEDQQLKAYTLAAAGDTLVVGYSPDRLEGESQLRQSNKSSQVVINKNGEIKRFDFGQTYQSLKPCGHDTLCARQDQTLDVYDVSGSDKQLLFTMYDAVDTMVSGDQTYFVSEDRVVSLDMAKREGFVPYEFGEYRYCGIYPAGDKFLLCVINNRDKKSILLVDQSKPSDDIDKKIQSLLAIEEIKDLSIYGKFITISPETGTLRLLPEIDQFGYDPATIKQSNQRIDQALAKLELAKDGYKVRNISK